MSLVKLGDSETEETLGGLLEAEVVTPVAINITDTRFQIVMVGVFVGESPEDVQSALC
jgi:hypothetical protein